MRFDRTARLILHGLPDELNSKVSFSNTGGAVQPTGHTRGEDLPGVRLKVRVTCSAVRVIFLADSRLGSDESIES